MTKPLVAIECLVYNHEPYLRECLEGFIIQKTNFPFLVVIHDDKSTDNSVEIIHEYVNKYPNIFIPIYEKENQYSKGDDTLDRIVEDVIYQTKAKYVAYCEGDDYWIDPLKLQKQVDFLENHPDYSMCFHAADVVLEGVDAKHKGAHCENIIDKEYTSTEMFSEWIVPTASIVYRQDVVRRYPIKHVDWLTRGDICLVLKCAHTGRVWGMSDRMSVYRMQPNSVSHNPIYRGKEYIKLPKHFRCLYINFPKLDKEPIKWCISHAYYSKMKSEHGIWKKMRDGFLWVFWDPKQAINKIYELLNRKVHHKS